MALILKTQVALMEGCELRYDCPMMSGEDYRSDAFFKKYRGRTAYFVGYNTKLVGPLDHLGRLPGVYVNPEGLKVRFEREEEVRSLNEHHLVVVDPTRSMIVGYAGPHQRLDELPNPILFYPGDTVRYKGDTLEKHGSEVRRVASVFLDKNFVKVEGVPMYDLFETKPERQARHETAAEDKSGSGFLRAGIDMIARTNKVSGDEIELVARGNAWALYHDPSKLSFYSDKDELEFWRMGGLSSMVAGSKIDSESIEASLMASAFGHGSFDMAYKIFVDGEADLVSAEEFKNPGDKERYRTHKLHACFAKHSERVRALTKRLYPEGVQGQFAL